MEFIRIVLYILLLLLLAGIALFNVVYRRQVKRVEKTLSIQLSPLLSKLQDIDVIAPFILLLSGVVIAILSVGT